MNHRWNLVNGAANVLIPPWSCIRHCEICCNLVGFMDRDAWSSGSGMLPWQPVASLTLVQDTAGCNHLWFKLVEVVDLLGGLGCSDSWQIPVPSTQQVGVLVHAMEQLPAGQCAMVGASEATQPSPR